MPAGARRRALDARRQARFGDRRLRSAAERVRSLVEKSHIRDNGLTLKVTVSIGATLAGQTDTADSIIKRADTLLYKSKENGRNRCTVG